MSVVFPGINPFIEETYWPDFHSGFAYELKAQIKHQLPPGLAVHLEVTTLLEEIQLSNTKAYRPDISVSTTGDGPVLEDAEDGRSDGAVIEIVLPVVREVNQRTVEIRDKQNNRLVAAVEILSPANKRSPNLKEYRAKRLDYRKRGVHFLELDFLRLGPRPFYQEDWPETTYTVQLFNAHWHSLKVWPLGMADTLPTVVLPLLNEQPGVRLELADTLKRVTANSDYEQLDVHRMLSHLREVDRSFLTRLLRT